MQKEIAFFDFDGTITRKDTMLELAAFHAGRAAFLWKMIGMSPSLIALKLKLTSAQKAKEVFLTRFFGGMEINNFNLLCEEFCKTKLPALIREDALYMLNMHKASAAEVVVVTASASNWVKPWCTQNGITCISSELQILNSRITGKLEGNNCNGKEKVSRIKALFNLADFKTIYAYGDSSGDRPMLNIATQPGFRVFKQ